MCIEYQGEIPVNRECRALYLCQSYECTAIEHSNVKWPLVNRDWWYNNK